MNRPGFGERHDCRKFVRRHGAQAVRRNADIGARQRADSLACAGDQRGKLVDRADEAALAGMRCGSAKGAVRVEARQQRQSDASHPSGVRNSRRHLCRVGVGRAVLVVMEIVEFPDARIALLEHLDIEQCSDSFDVVRRHLQREAIYRLAPCPERIGGVAPRFREPRHAALEGVTVQARHSRDR